MTQNSYQIPFSGVIQFAKKIAGGRVFIHDTPQIGRHFQSEQTETREETYFDNAYRCALIDAGLPLEELKSAGVIGAGFILREHELRNVDRAGTPLNSTNIASLRNENYCHEIHAQSTRDRFGENLSTELGEIQAFTTAINDVIAQILDSELKLDRLKVQ